jgi:pimeloyl-ACP methyl ester carboxylesterase
MAPNSKGLYTAWGCLWTLLHLVVPCAYLYIGGTILHELLTRFGVIPVVMHQNTIVINNSSSFFRWLLQLGCWFEALFYIFLKVHVTVLNRKDTLEASLSAAPMMELPQREELWRQMMDCEQEDPIGFLTGWFFDAPNIQTINHYDVRDFLCWSMWEGRNQEHLTVLELEQLEEFVHEIEWRISLQMYGPKEPVNEEDTGMNDEGCQFTGTCSQLEEPVESLADEAGTKADKEDSIVPQWKKDLPQPNNHFRFGKDAHKEQPSFFSDLYERYSTRYDQFMENVNTDLLFQPVQDLRDMLQDFHPVQNMKHVMAEAAQTISNAEESAKAKANQMYETVITPGSQMDKQLTAMSQATYAQLAEAWNSVVTMKERLETARFVAKQRQRIRQQLKGYRVMLHKMREMSYAVSAKQMADMMRRITECNKALEGLEHGAQTAFEQATGFARKNLPFLQRQEPRSFAKYSSDPLLGVAAYPLCLCLTILAATEIPLRVWMRKRGFERRCVGAIAYYVHTGAVKDDDESKACIGKDDNGLIPIVFVHGIGIGLITYIPLIEALLATGRPIILPELPYVSAFRPLQSPHSVLSPGAVTSTMTAILATHGYMSAAWMGHSYGTSWLAYMVKYAPHTVSAVLFLDPICFCLHAPRLTKSFVYMRPDLGASAYFVRTDVMVNWTVQRSFPWPWIVLFLEQINMPCSVFLSSNDGLVPADIVESYLSKKLVPICDFETVTDEFYNKNDGVVNCTIFRGDEHGDWTDRPLTTVPVIVTAVEALCRRAEALKEETAQSS